jgi:hypothetical protein
MPSDIEGDGRASSWSSTSSREEFLEEGGGEQMDLLEADGLGSSVGLSDRRSATPTYADLEYRGMFT